LTRLVRIFSATRVTFAVPSSIRHSIGHTGQPRTRSGVTAHPPGLDSRRKYRHHYAWAETGERSRAIRCLPHLGRLLVLAASDGPVPPGRV